MNLFPYCLSLTWLSAQEMQRRATCIGLIFYMTDPIFYMYYKRNTWSHGNIKRRSFPSCTLLPLTIKLSPTGCLWGPRSLQTQGLCTFYFPASNALPRSFHPAGTHSPIKSQLRGTWVARSVKHRTRFQLRSWSHGLRDPALLCEAPCSAGSLLWDSLLLPLPPPHVCLLTLPLSLK